MDKKCRTCAKDRPDLIPLLGKSRKSEVLIREYNFAIKGHLKQEASEADPLPKKICKDCFKELEITVKFLQQCIEAEKQLKTLEKEDSKTAKEKQNKQTETKRARSKKKLPKSESKTFENSQKTAVKLKLPDIKEEDTIQDDYLDDVEDEKPHIEDIQLEVKQTISTLDSNYTCNLCGKSFKRSNALKTHYSTHDKDQNFTCDYCQRTFANKFRLKNHIRIHTGERPYQCKTCNMTFAQLNALKCHIRLHTGDKPYKCSVCEKRFAQNSTLKTHMALHTGKTIQCDLCDKRFTRASFLIQHRRDHTGDRPYACHICPNRYKQKSHLDHHLEVHAGTKYTCEVCGRKYSKKWSLKVHSYTHTKDSGEKLPYPCKYCDESFVRKDKLKVHVQLKHEMRRQAVHEDVTEVPAPSNIVEVESKPDPVQKVVQLTHRKFHLVNITGNSATIQEITLPIEYEAM